MLVHQRSLLRRNLVRRSGAELRERFGQLTPGVHIGLNSVRESAQSLDHGIFARGEILLHPLFRELRNVQEQQTQREKPPSARLADQSKFAGVAARDRDRDKG